MVNYYYCGVVLDDYCYGVVLVVVVVVVVVYIYRIINVLC